MVDVELGLVLAAARMSDAFAFGLVFGACALVFVGIVLCAWIFYLRGGDAGEGFTDELSPALIEGAPVDGELIVAGSVWRQRYECTCGFRGTRELAFPPAHIKCPRCAGVAVGIGAAELVT